MTVTELPPEPMNGTDAALWDIERDPSLRTTVVSVLVLDRPISERRIIGALDAASRVVRRMRQRVVEQPLGIGVPNWVVVDDLDVADHLRFVDSDEPVPLDVALDVAQGFAEQPFDRSRPLWECAYVSRVEGDRSALVIKVHHSFTDGVGGVELLDAFLDTSRTPPASGGDPLPEIRSAQGESGSLVRSVWRTTDAIVARTATTLDTLGHTALDSVTHPRRSVTTAVAGSSSAIRMLRPSGAGLSTLMIERGPGRRLAVHDVDLDRMHEVGQRAGYTINHLFVAGVMEGAASYHEKHGADVEELRVLMPINIRSSDDADAGNQWAPVRFRLPSASQRPLARLEAIRRITADVRREPALGFSHSIAGLVQLLPSAVSSGIVGAMMRGVDVVATNVPGLAGRRYLAGARVVRLYPFAPTGGAAFNAALMSHDGTACLGLMSDTSAVADPDDLHARIAAGIDRVIAAAAA